RLPAVAHEVRHESAPELRVLAEDRQRLLAEPPGLAGRCPVVPAERGEEPELRPPDVERGRRLAPESPDVVAPVGEPAHRAREAAAEGIGQVEEGALRVTRPVARVALDARRRAA